MKLPKATIDSIVKTLIVEMSGVTQLKDDGFYDLLSHKTGYCKRICKLAVWQILENLKQADD